MSDLVSRQAAMDAVMEMGKRIPTYAIRCKDAIENLPSAQPEIIRCKECSRWCICHRSDDWYCADAERRKNG